MSRKGPWTPYKIPHNHRLNFNPSPHLSLFHILNLHYTTKPSLKCRVIPRPKQPPSCNHNHKFIVKISCYLRQTPTLNLTPLRSLTASTPNPPPLALCPHGPHRLTSAAPGRGGWVARLLCCSPVPSMKSSQLVTAAGFQDVLPSCHICLSHGQAASGKTKITRHSPYLEVSWTANAMQS